MKKFIFSIVIMLVVTLFFGCEKSPPTDQQIFEAIKTKSVIARHSFFELKKVYIKSTAWEDVNFKAELKITFLYHRIPGIWNREGKCDFIPSGTTLVKGMNSIDATAFFQRSYAGDGSWYLESFSL